MVPSGLVVIGGDFEDNRPEIDSQSASVELIDMQTNTKTENNSNSPID